MAKKKTGRKILGSSVAHPLTVRIDDVLRERLQQEADKRAERKHGWNLSQEILMRLNQSLDGDEEDKRKRGPLWAISYLMGQIETNGLLSILLTDQFERRILPKEQQPPWHRNADVFEGQRPTRNRTGHAHSRRRQQDGAGGVAALDRRERQERLGVQHRSSTSPASRAPR